MTRINNSTALSAITFIYLNVIDAYITGIALYLGAIELNPFMITGWYSSIYKFIMSLIIVVLLWKFGKSRLLAPLNICMFMVVIWNMTQVLFS